jgi:hypothetical protein
MALTVANAAANAATDAITALLNGGLLKVYAGTRPATANTAITTQTLLGTATFGNPAFGSASGGIATANAIASGVIAASGTASFFRVFKSDGTTAMFDGSVDTVSADLVVDTTGFTAGQTFSVSAFLFRAPLS